MKQSFFGVNKSTAFGSVSLDFILEAYEALPQKDKDILTRNSTTSGARGTFVKKFFGIPRQAFRTILFACGFDMSKRYDQIKGIIRDPAFPSVGKQSVVFIGEYRDDIPNYLVDLYQKHQILTPYNLKDCDTLITDIGESWWIKQNRLGKATSNKTRMEQVEDEFDKAFPIAAEAFKQLEDNHSTNTVYTGKDKNHSGEKDSTELSEKFNSIGDGDE